MFRLEKMFLYRNFIKAFIILLKGQIVKFSFWSFDPNSTEIVLQ